MRPYILSLLIFVAFGSSAEELPFSSFGHLPMVTEPEVSPDGKYIALIINSEEGPSINVAEFGGREMTPVARLKYGADRIEWIEWVNNDRLLIASSNSILSFGDRIRVGRLFSVDKDGKDLQEIRRKTANEPAVWTLQLDTTNVIDWLVDDPEHVLMQLYDELDEAWAVFKVNIYKNRFDKLFTNSYDVQDWNTDGRGNVVFGIAYEDNIATTWYRPDADSKWQKLYERQMLEDERFDPIMINGDTAIVFSDHEIGRLGIWSYDIPSGEYGEVMFSAEVYDVESAILSVDRTEVIGASYYADYRVDHYFDAANSATAELVAKSFPKYQTAMVSLSEDRQRMIVLATKDDSPPKYFWLDLAAGKGGIWFSQYPYLENQALASKQGFEFEARDGTKLNGYLTLPLETNGKKPKTIVFPHGGPHSRDYKYFDPYVQFLANRGYAVLQVNFRGSEGFGNNYEIAGYREWGQAMQDDVYDAIDWLTEQDLADTEQMCLVGASYGGYVALVAAYERPKQFECFVSISGVSDLHEMVSMRTKFTRDKSAIGVMIGNPNDSDDKKMMNDNSAINHIEKIQRPILLVHGTYDTQVRPKQSRDFYKKAKRAGVKVEYLELNKGTHYFDEYDNRLALFEALEKFLDKHL